MSHASLASRRRAGQAGQASLLTASSGSEVLGAEGLREGGSRRARDGRGELHGRPRYDDGRYCKYVEEARRSSKSWYRPWAAPRRSKGCIVAWLPTAFAEGLYGHRSADWVYWLCWVSRRVTEAWSFVSTPH